MAAVLCRIAGPPVRQRLATVTQATRWPSLTMAPHSTLSSTLQRGGRLGHMTRTAAGVTCRNNPLCLLGSISMRMYSRDFDPSVPPSVRGGYQASRKRAKRMERIMRIGGAIIFCHIVVWTLVKVSRNQATKIKLQEIQKNADGGDDFKVHRDPHMSKDASMMKYKGTWIPLQLYVGNSGFETIQDLAINDQDILVVSFPKSGTTWLQQIVYLIHTDLDVTKASAQTMEERFPYMEYVYPGIKALTKMPSPRLIKTHLPYHLQPDAVVKHGRGKVIYIARNPKDVSVSLYHFLRMFTMANYKGTFPDFLDSFLEGKVSYGPWWEHVAEFWEHRSKPNILFLTYEELQQNPLETINKIATFLGKSLSKEEASKIAELCSFKSMKSDSSTNYSWWDDLGLRNKQESQFMRKGVVGDWKNYFTQDMFKKVDAMTEEHLLPKGLQFVDDV